MPAAAESSANGGGGLQVVRAAYDLSLCDTNWNRNLVEALCESWPGGGPRAGFGFFSHGDGRLTLEGDHHSPDGAGPAMVAGVLEGFRDAARSPGEVVRLFDHVAAGTLATRLDELGSPHLLRALQSAGVADARAICCGNPGGAGFVFFSYLGRRGRVSAAWQRRWLSVASHVAAARRLRHRIGGERPLEVAPWIWSDGRIQHSDPSMRSGATSARLCDAARALGRPRRLDRWASLVSGRWTVLHAGDTDGKRFVVALENAPSATPVPGLSQRQAQVLGYLLQGHSQKFIAYELGLAQSTIAQHAAALRARYGAPTNTSLVTRLSTMLDGRKIQREGGVEVRVARKTLPALSAAEKSLLRGLEEGLSDTQLAERRGAKVKTVRNQLHRLYRRFGVHSRVELIALLTRPSAHGVP